MLVRVAGTGRCAETCFQTSKHATSLDEHRSAAGTPRTGTPLVMLVHAILTVIATREHSGPPAHHQLIPLTVNEIRRPLVKMIADTIHTIASGWPGPAGAACTTMEEFRVKSWPSSTLSSVCERAPRRAIRTPTATEWS